MDLKTALHHVQSLADGVDPTTGEILPSTSPYNQPDIIRALFKVLAAAQTGSTTPVASSPSSTDDSRPARQGQRWTDEERQQLTERFQRGETQISIAKSHERSSGAIRSELIRLGLIEENA